MVHAREMRKHLAVNILVPTWTAGFLKKKSQLIPLSHTYKYLNLRITPGTDGNIRFQLGIKTLIAGTSKVLTSFIRQAPGRSC